MLQSLHIQNYALIENLDMTFHSGFSVITGETGAGKSIILGALGLILGQRADAKSIKPGAKRCVVEAVFDLSGGGMEPFFESNNLDFDGCECIVRRELSVTGKSRSFINDTPVSLAVLRELSVHLVDIHSQHQNLLLNEENFQLNILDTLAHDQELKTQYQSLFNALQTASRQLNEFTERIARERGQVDFWTFQLQEIDEAKLDADEQTELEQESTMLENAEEIKHALYEAETILTGEEGGITSQVQTALRALQGISDVFPRLENICERLESCSIELEDLAQDVSNASESVNFDPERASYVNDRLNTIYTLQKKHQCDTVAALLSYADNLREKLGNIQDSDELLTTMRNEHNRLHRETLQLASRLSEVRRAICPRVEQEMQTRLQTLGMPHIRFEVQLTQLSEPTLNGIDRVAFLFSANKNAPLQNVENVASGGEIARVMLSLKALLTSTVQLPTIIFDEIDTGVSGQIAEKMALMMRSMSCGGQQVVSITHLPQIASWGEHHYKVYKQDDEQGTATHIRELTSEERVVEIAHMLSGAVLSDAALNNARELLMQKTSI